MTWKCDICDTYNEEHQMECYVCGQSRSKVSIREGKIRAREERIKKINDYIYHYGYRSCLTAFIIGLSLSLIVIVLSLIMKISNGAVGELVVNLINVFEYSYEHVISSVSTNMKFIIVDTFRNSFLDVGNNITFVFLKWRYMISTMVLLLSGYIGINAKNNILFCFNNRVLPMYQLVVQNISSKMTIFSMLITKATSLVERGLNILIYIINNVKSSLN